MPVLQWCDTADAVLEDLTTEKSSTDYVLFRVDNPKKSPTCVLVESGQGGRARIVDLLHVAEEDTILVGVFLCSALDERGSVVSVQRKYIQVTWIGPNVSVMIKGKLNSWTADLRGKFPHCAVTVTCSGGDVEDLHPDMLMASLAAAGGAHKPTRYSFTNKTLIGSLQLDQAAAEAAEAERLRREAEIQAQREAAAERKRLAEEKKRREAEEKARLEAERQAALEARRLEEEARRKAEEEARLARIQAEEARRKAEQEAKRQAAAEAERQRLEAERLAREEAERQRTKILIDTNATLNGKKLVLLVSNVTSNFAQSTAIDRVRTMLHGLGLPKDEVEEVDGSDVKLKDKRNELFELSGIRAKYPQVFLKETDGTLKFVGDFDAMEYYNDTGTLAQTLGVISSTTKRIVAVGDCAVNTKTSSESSSSLPPTVATNVSKDLAPAQPAAEPAQSVVAEEKSIDAKETSVSASKVETETTLPKSAEREGGVGVSTDSEPNEEAKVETVEPVTTKEKEAVAMEKPADVPSQTDMANESAAVDQDESLQKETPTGGASTEKTATDAVEEAKEDRIADEQEASHAVKNEEKSPEEAAPAADALKTATSLETADSPAINATTEVKELNGDAVDKPKPAADVSETSPGKEDGIAKNVEETGNSAANPEPEPIAVQDEANVVGRDEPQNPTTPVAESAAPDMHEAAEVSPEPQLNGQGITDEPQKDAEPETKTVTTESGTDSIMSETTETKQAEEVKPDIATEEAESVKKDPPGWRG